VVVDAGSEQAVAELRKRKGRKSKPLAVMAASLTVARKFCHISREAEDLLQGFAHPIVLCPEKNLYWPVLLHLGFMKLG